MNQGKIAVRYARALFQSALEKGLEEEVYKDMLLVLETSGYDDFREIMANAVIKPEKKNSIVREIFGKSINPLTLNLLSLLISNNRGEYLSGVARMYIDEIRRYKGITPVHITTAEAIGKEMSDKIGAVVSREFSTQVELTGDVKEDLIGGFVLRIGDKYMDLSIKKQLAVIKRELSGS